MSNPSPSLLSDQELLEATARVADDERWTTAELIALLAELDLRKLYLGQGYSSLFTYCTQALRLSESAAYGRITAARATRRFPMILGLLTDGDITLTTVSLLAAHLTDENYEALLDAARHKSKRDIERLVASLCAQPDIPACVRRLSTASSTSGRFNPPLTLELQDIDGAAELPIGASSAAETTNPAPQHTPSLARPRNAVAPLATDRYLLRVTITGETHARFERARDLLRHTLPGGDPVAIIDRALTVLVEQLERQKVAAVQRPRAKASRPSRGRHVPAATRRAVWTRDRGRCAFIGPHGRCAETGFLEFHHVVPFAAGGSTTIDNLELRCRAHNAFEAEITLVVNQSQTSSPNSSIGFFLLQGSGSGRRRSRAAQSSRANGDNLSSGHCVCPWCGTQLDLFYGDSINELAQGTGVCGSRFQSKTLATKHPTAR